MSEAPEIEIPTEDPFAELPGDREEAPGAAAKAETPPEPEPAAEEPPEPAEEPVAEEPAAEEEETPPETPPKKDWKDKQIIKARAAEKKLREEQAADRAEIARLKALAGDSADAPAPAKTETEIRGEVEAKLRQEQRFEKINTSAEAMFEAGKKAFPKGWEERVNQAAEAIGPEIAARPDFLETLTDLPNAHAVYFDLASDPDRIEALLQMSPSKMGLELGRLSEKLAATKPKTVSRVPTPIRPLDKPTKEDLPLDDPNMSMEEFDRRMRLEEEKRYKEKVARGY